MKVISRLKPLIIIGTLLSSSSALAYQFEISAMLGQMYSSDLLASDDSSISVDSGTNIALGVAWQKNHNGQGQILLNRVSHDFSGEDNSKGAIDITYAHFNGVALFRQQNYVTTMSLGLGGAYFDSEQGNQELYPSASIAFGTRYEVAQNVAIVTELRAYATLVDNDDAMFCQQDVCHAAFDNSLWFDSAITLGIAIKY
ncbi:hypothetical protein SAMN05216262_101558 [Colwellia chukchiensis]|uniref:Outer membrane protein beta-barrel domain-containing protein n=1 Tax=Colwellia chukchiensis TaxID=641665 RepID=A0A1H7HNN4_9GAMM|nr:hypothetical protein [Colwellia chukchiensis]SEK52003.1 hypothetical protein SAMN05216262_101558 [Colwellia chukchiensis]